MKTVLRPEMWCTLKCDPILCLRLLELSNLLELVMQSTLDINHEYYENSDVPFIRK